MLSDRSAWCRKHVWLIGIALTCVAAVLTFKMAAVRAQDGGGGDPPPLSDLMAQAEDLRNQLRWDEAIAKLREIVSRAEEDRSLAARAQTRIGKFLIDQGKLDEAEAELALVNQMFADQPEGRGWAALRQIDIIQRRGDLDGVETAAQSLANDTNVPQKFRVWARVKSAEVPIVKGDQLAMIPVLEQIIAENKDTTPEPVNWARIDLVYVLTDKVKWDHAVRVADEVITDHAAGKATDEQAAFALLWKSRALERSERFDEATDPAQMAAGLALGRYPHVAYEVEYHLGQIYQRQGSGLKTGWGALHIAAMNHYGQALAIAESAGLSAEKADYARMRYAGEMRHLGMLEKSLAWLRMGIEDPARMTLKDQQLAQQIAKYIAGQSELAEAWQHYLNDPANEPDPMQVFVLKEFSQESSPASSTVLHTSIRRRWLGEFYIKQRRYEEAVQSYLSAVTEAVEEPNRAHALSGLTQAYAKRAARLTRQRAAAEAQAMRDLAYQTAGQAAEMWIQLAKSGTDAESHAAIEKAVRAYGAVYRTEESLRVAQRLCTELASGSESKRAFADYMLMQALFWSGDRAGAVAAAQALDDTYGNSDRSDVQDICRAALVRASAYYVHLGDPQTGIQMLDYVENRYPDTRGEWIEHYKAFCEKAVTESDDLPSQ